MSRKILFVGMLDSPHTARWINLVADEGWELHFFPVYHAFPHPLLRNVIVHEPWWRLRPLYILRTFFRNPLDLLKDDPDKLPTRAILPFPVMHPFDRFLKRFKTKPLGESDVQAPLFLGPKMLARLIKKLKPDLIHSMEFQHAGYNVLRAKELSGNRSFPKWLATNWGSDIFYYRNFPDHNKQISRLLQNIDYYSCECERDILLAREMGLKTKAMPVLPNTGGFDIQAIDSIRSSLACSQRKIIMVKGYQHFAGRALTALDALILCKDVLRDYRIVIFSASLEVRKRCDELWLFHGLNVVVTDYLTHEKMLTYFANARIYLGVSISDAISTSMLEAMAMGAFPIQTNTSCCEEWIDDGISGFSIPVDDVQAISEKIRRAVTDDALVDHAAKLNWQTVCARLDQRVLRVKEVEFYDEVFSDISSPA